MSWFKKKEYHDEYIQKTSGDPPYLEKQKQKERDQSYTYKKDVPDSFVGGLGICCSGIILSPEYFSHKCSG